MIAIRDGNNPNNNSGFNLPLFVRGIIPDIVHVNIQLFIKHIICSIYHTDAEVLVDLVDSLIIKYYN